MSWFYGPDGASGIFEECPEGWADHPCKVKAPINKLAEAVETITEAAEAISKFDHDGDGRPGGSKPRRKKAVNDGKPA